MSNDNIISDKEHGGNVFSDSSDHYDKIKLKKENKSLKNITFNIMFDSNEWEEIRPIEKLYKNGQKGHVLKPGWPDILVRKIYLAEKLPCAYNFKRHKIDDIDAYIKMDIVILAMLLLIGETRTKPYTGVKQYSILISDNNLNFPRVIRSVASTNGSYLSTNTYCFIG